MNQDDMKPTKQPGFLTTPPPIVGDQLPQTQPTPGTENRSGIAVWLPRLIIAAIVINMIPAFFSLFGQQYQAMGTTVRNYANIVFIIAFVIIIIKQVTNRGNNA